jgi:glycosyltransferase involved in cell wall biosynthesis
VISVVVLTFDEEINIERCLRSVRFSDDVLVVDSGSRDRTVERATALGARVLHRPFDDFASQRNFAMECGALRHPWVLHLDADEEATPALVDELRSIAAQAAPPAAIWKVPSRLLLDGAWLRHSGMYPSYQVRFGRREVLRFVQHGHGQREAPGSGPVGTIQAPLDHHNFSKGIADWLRRHVRYAADEAAQAAGERFALRDWPLLFSTDPTTRRRALKSLSYRMPFRPSLRFLYVYLLRRGFLDGVAGYRYARLLATYESMIECLRSANIGQQVSNARHSGVGRDPDRK